MMPWAGRCIGTDIRPCLPPHLGYIQRTEWDLCPAIDFRSADGGDEPGGGDEE